MIWMNFIGTKIEIYKIMSERKINLEEILMSGSIGTLFRGTCNEKTYQFILGRMKEACQQTLELAAENTIAGCDFGSMSTQHGNLYATFAGHIGKVIIDKQSILNTINQVE